MTLTSLSRRLVIAIPVFFLLVFTSFWWNRYLALTNDGWHFLHGWEILHGHVPYKDFFLFIPPLHPLKDAFLIWLFGDKLIVPQVWGIVERIFLTVVLAVWLRSYFGSFAAALATLLAMCLFLCGQAETLSSLYEEAIFFPSLACVAVSRAIGLTRAAPWWTVAAGACSGLAILAKQTSGVAATLAGAGLLAAIVWRREDARAAIRTTTLFAAGWAVPVGAVAIWLASRGALGLFLFDVFIGAPSSKGTLAQMLTRSPAMIYADVYFRRHLYLAVVMLAIGAYMLRRWSDGRSHLEPTDGRWMVALGLGSVICLTGIYFFSEFGPPRLPGIFLTLIPDVTVLCGELGCLIIFLYYLPGFIRDSLDSLHTQLFAVAGMSFALEYFISFSWPMFPPMLIPGFAFVLAFLLSRVNVGKAAVAFRAISLCACLIAATLMGWMKMCQPYNWQYWTEPNVSTATRELPYPETAGLRVSPETEAFVERVVSDIQTNSAPGEAVFEYPAAPILYLLSHRRPSTLSFIHFVDTTPDYIAEEDARRILANPPAVLVYFEQTEEQVREGEVDFRGGHRSGQRSIIEAITKLQPRYSLLDRLETPISHRNVDVYAIKR